MFGEIFPQLAEALAKGDLHKRTVPLGVGRAQRQQYTREYLDEVRESALILLVTDISNPQHAEQDAEVEKILKGLGVGDRPRLHVLNKIDQLTPEHATAMNGNPNSVRVSALKGTGLEELLARIDAAMPVDPILHLRFELPLKDGRAIALVHALGRVFHSEVNGAVMAMEAELPTSVARRLKISSEANPG